MYFLLKAMFWEISNTQGYAISYFGSQSVCSPQASLHNKIMPSNLWNLVPHKLASYTMYFLNHVKGKNLFSGIICVIFVLFIQTRYNSAVFYRIILQVLHLNLMIIVKVGLGKHNLPKQNKPSRPPIPLFSYEANVIGQRHIILI